MAAVAQVLVLDGATKRRLITKRAAAELDDLLEQAGLSTSQFFSFAVLGLRLGANSDVSGGNLSEKYGFQSVEGSSSTSAGVTSAGASVKAGTARQFERPVRYFFDFIWNS